MNIKSLLFILLCSYSFSQENILTIKKKNSHYEIEKYNDTIPKITAHEPPTILRLKTNLN